MCKSIRIEEERFEQIQTKPIPVNYINLGMRELGSFMNFVNHPITRYGQWSEKFQTLFHIGGIDLSKIIYLEKKS